MLWRCRPSSTLHTSRFVHSWWRPTWPKHPAICCYWLIDSARSMPSSMLIKICSPIVQCKDAISVHEHTTEVHKGLVVGRDDCETSHTRPPYYWCGMWVNVVLGPFRLVHGGVFTCNDVQACSQIRTYTRMHMYLYSCVFLSVNVSACFFSLCLSMDIRMLWLYVHVSTTWSIIIVTHSNFGEIEL